MFSETLRKIEAKLTDTLAGLGDGPFPTFGFGARELDIQGEPPRIIWIPVGGQIGTLESYGADGVSNPRALWTRRPVVAAHVFAADIDAVETLALHMVAAIHDTLTLGSYRMVSESWDTWGFTDNGVVAIFSFEMHMPLVREKVAEAEIVTLRIVGGLT